MHFFFVPDKKDWNISVLVLLMFLVFLLCPVSVEHVIM